MIRPIALALTAVAVLAATACGPPNPQVELQTPFGVIRVEVDSARAPRTAANFLRYVDEGRYDGASFYRVRRDPPRGLGQPMAVVQGGLWAGDTTRLLPPVAFESTRRTGLAHTDGAVSMARFDDVDGARAEFFVVVGTQPHLDHAGPDRPGYAVFGRVVEGMELVRAMGRLPVRRELLRRPVPFRAVRVRGGHATVRAMRDSTAQRATEAAQELLPGDDVARDRGDADAGAPRAGREDPRQQPSPARHRRRRPAGAERARKGSPSRPTCARLRRVTGRCRSCRRSRRRRPPSAAPQR